MEIPRPNRGVPDVAVVGALPPPVHGAAQVTAWVSAALRGRARVINLDTAPHGFTRGIGYHLRRVTRVLAATVRLVAGGVGQRAGAVYLSAAGGAGAAYDMMIVVTARLLRRPLFIHHHSFAYVDRFEGLVALLLRLAGPDSHHICLCPRMAESLASRYGAGRTMVLSNAAFHAPCADTRPSERPAGALRLGHLSNLCRDKGLDLVLETFAMAGTAAGQLVLAGEPVDDDAVTILAEAAGRFGARLEMRGQVSGSDKNAFFSDIDVFLFPTRYVNEAEPLVVIEALAAGVPVIAFGRGCIPHIIPNDAGRVIAPEAPFPEDAAAMIANWARDPAAWHHASTQARVTAEYAHRQAQPALKALIDALIGAAVG